MVAAPSASPWNLPNAITVARLILTFVVLGLMDATEWWITSAVLFVVAALSDALDGYLARKWNQITTLGRILDPFVDKILVGGAFIFLAARPESGVTPWLTFAVWAREMFITGLRSMMEQGGKDFSAQWSGKLKMALQSATVPVCMLSLSPQFEMYSGSNWSYVMTVRNVLLWVTLFVTVYSGVEYTWRAWQVTRKTAS
jgi:CDP-diacylglycerol--glycerol-3-phosphate 3-phosphatidyltransferase